MVKFEEADSKYFAVYQFENPPTGYSSKQGSIVIFIPIFLRDTTASWKQELSLCRGSVVCSPC